MPSRQLVPRIRVDLLDASLYSLSSSSTLDIKDILSQARRWPNLLAEDLVFDNADDVLCLEDSYSQDIPPFPAGHQPPLFILHSHRMRLPFPIRSEALEMGDFCGDEEGACLLLTAPTIPRMKFMMKEHVYVQKWVDTLTSDSPPKHIPWSCEKPAAERKWIAEGSIFPTGTAKFSPERHTVTRGYSNAIGTNRFSARADHVPHLGELCTSSEASAPTHASAGSHTATRHIPVKSVDVGPGTLRGEPRISHFPPSIVKASQVSSPLSLRPSGLSIGTTSTTPNAPLATRRGKPLSGLELKGSVIEQLEYPDIPTAFRGSPSVWSPCSDAFHFPSFTDHQNMLLDLKLKCAALGSGVLSCVPENQCLPPATTRSVDEWVLSRGFAALDTILGSDDGQAIKDIIPDTSIFRPDNTSTPARDPSCTARQEFVPRLYPAAVLESPVRRFSDPPGVPLPPRPALVNPSTPPHVRGILKKTKSVRFEDVITMESRETSLRPAQPSPERSLPRYLAATSVRPCTPMPNTAKSSRGPVPVKELPTSWRNVEKNPALRSRPPPKRTKANGTLDPIHFNDSKSWEPSRLTGALAPVERPCRPKHVKRNTNPITAQGKQKRPPVIENDIRRGIEGAAKSRLSVPLRNIFRLK